MTRVAHSAVAVRRATRADIESVLALRRSLLAAGEAHWARGDAGGWEAAYRAQLEEEINGTVSAQATFLAVADAAPMGVATAIIDRRLVNPANPKGFEGWIQGVYVNRSARGLGLGTALTRAAEDWLAARGADAIYLDSTPSALRMYARLGYVINDEPHLRKELH